MENQASGYMTIEDLIGVFNKAVEGGASRQSMVYVCGRPECSNDCKIEKAKPIYSACSCESNKHLVLLVEE